MYSDHKSFILFRFIKLMFEASPTEATRKGYRLPPPASYLSLCRSLCTGEVGDTLNCELSPLLAQRACSYDHLLDISSKEEVAEFCGKVASLLEEAEGIERSAASSSLSPDQSVDLKIIISQLKLQRVRWEEVQQHRRNAGFYLPLYPLLHLLPTWDPDPSLAGPSCPTPPTLPQLSHPGVVLLSVAERMVALLVRLRAIPGVLENARVNLTSPVRVFVEMALSVCASFQAFLEESVPKLSAILVSFDPSLGPAPVILEKINLASKVAALSVQKYAAFLRENVLSISSADVSIGKETFDKILQLEHFIESSESLLDMGNSHFKEVKAQLETLAREIDPSRTWQEITDQVIRPIHSTAEELLADFMSEINRARQHTQEKKLVSGLPQGDCIVGTYTSKFLIPFTPFGDFLNPSPFAGMEVKPEPYSAEPMHQHLVGHLHLHGVQPSMTELEKEECLCALDHTFITVVAPHESYPGHHVQALLAQTHPRLLRKYFESPLFYEGWGLYTEELAYESGFFHKDHHYTGNEASVTIPAGEYEKLARLTQLRLRLWRAARILLDVQLNIGELSFEVSQKFLQREVLFSAEASCSETLIYLSQPGYASCYVAGFLMLLQLRERARLNSAQASKPFSLQEFHDSLLVKGCLPFKLLQLLL